MLDGATAVSIIASWNEKLVERFHCVCVSDALLGEGSCLPSPAFSKKKNNENFSAFQPFYPPSPSLPPLLANLDFGQVSGFWQTREEKPAELKGGLGMLCCI